MNGSKVIRFLAIFNMAAIIQYGGKSPNNIQNDPVSQAESENIYL